MESKIFQLNTDLDLNDPEIAAFRERKRLDEIQSSIAAITGVPTAKQTAPVPIKSPCFVLPDDAAFSTFYKELQCYAAQGSGGCSSVALHKDGNIIKMKAALSEISVSIDAIIELLAKEFSSPLLLESTQKVTGQPPFIDDMENRVFNKMQNIRMEFNHILAFGDPKIRKLCHDYYILMSYPLVVRHEYDKWERSLIGFKMQQVLENGNIEYAQKEKAIREDYNRKMHEELSKKELVITGFKTENSRYRIALESMNDRSKQLREEAQQFQSEIETIHNKNKALEDLNQKQEVELASSKAKASELDKKYAALEIKYQKLVDRMTERPEKAKMPQVKGAIGQEITSPQQKIVDYLQDNSDSADITEDQIAEGTGLPLDQVEKNVETLINAGKIVQEENLELGEPVYSIFEPS